MGSEGTFLREDWHCSGKRVALQAFWTKTEEEEEGEVAGGLRWWRAAEERERKRKRERRERERREAMEKRRKEDFGRRNEE